MTDRTVRAQVRVSAVPKNLWPGLTGGAADSAFDETMTLPEADTGLPASTAWTPA